MAYSLLRLGFWKSYVITMRPYLLFISGSAGLLGLAFASNLPSIKFALAFAVFFLSYGLGQALTDCFQTDTDSISSPYRPLVKGLISKKQVLTVSITGLIAGIIILFYLNPKILFLGVLSVVGLLTYTYLKRTWWGGPPWNSWIVALLPIMGIMTDAEFNAGTLTNFRNIHSIAFALSVGAVFFAYANFVVMGYFKDISADRKTGYRTFPVVFGWTPGAIYSDVTAIIATVLTGYALALLGGFKITAGLNSAGLLLFLAGAVLNLYGQIKLHLTRDEIKTHGPIANIVRAFVLYCLALTVTLKPSFIFLVIIFYLMFELTLRLRPEKSQI